MPPDMKPKRILPKLTLVGAGPGDPDLITVKGIKVLADADVVLYDALASEELLTYVPNRAVKIFVGKRAGMHISPHALRRTFATLALRAGMSPLHLQGFLG